MNYLRYQILLLKNYNMYILYIIMNSNQIKNLISKTIDKINKEHRKNNLENQEKMNEYVRKALIQIEKEKEIEKIKRENKVCGNKKNILKFTGGGSVIGIVIAFIFYLIIKYIKVNKAGANIFILFLSIIGGASIYKFSTARTKEQCIANWGKEYNFYDWLYHSTIVTSTVGFGDITPKTRCAKNVTIIHIIFLLIIAYIMDITKFTEDGSFIDSAQNSLNNPSNPPPSSGFQPSYQPSSGFQSSYRPSYSFQSSIQR